MAPLTTHDLATLSGFWQGADIDLAHRLDLYDDEQTWRLLLEERGLEWQALLDALRRSDCLPAKTLARAEVIPMSPALNAAMHLFVAQSRSALLGLQPEDWLEMATPVNVPGTTDACPNWRRKMTRDLETMFSDPEVIRLLTVVGHWRRLAPALAPIGGRPDEIPNDTPDAKAGVNPSGKIDGKPDGNAGGRPA